MSKLLLPLLILAATCQLAAQDLLTVRVGVFRDVKASEFAALKPLGFVYGIPSANNTTEVFVGHYNEQDKAVNIASNLQQQGYRNAQAFQLPVNTAPANYYIQLSLHSGSRPVEWPALERAGKLFVASTDGMSKIMTGPYPDAAAANNALPVIKSLGYRDAFIKQVDPARLITIGTFETGIKKPLIPINLQDTPPTTTVPALDPAPQAVNTPLSPAPGTYGSSPAPATAPPTTPSPNLTTTGLNAVTQGPSIDGRTKRSSAAELQRVLKEKGYYESTIDGYYGPGTTAAYETAWAGMPEISKYKMLANTLPLEYVGANWEETMVLVAIAEELSAGTANVSRAEQMLSQRPSLYAAGQPLTSPAATRVRNWAATIWTNLDEWAIEDPLHAQIFSAFRIAYHQTQVRLEDHYMQRGLKADDARDLATAMLQNLLGARLDRFL